MWCKLFKRKVLCEQVCPCFGMAGKHRHRTAIRVHRSKFGVPSLTTCSSCASTSNSGTCESGHPTTSTSVKTPQAPKVWKTLGPFVCTTLQAPMTAVGALFSASAEPSVGDLPSTGRRRAEKKSRSRTSSLNSQGGVPRKQQRADGEDGNEKWTWK